MIIYCLNQELIQDMKFLHLFICFSSFFIFFLGGGDDFLKKINSCHQILNPLPALTYQTILDLNAACRSKRTEAYWLSSS